MIWLSGVVTIPGPSGSGQQPELELTTCSLLSARRARRESNLRVSPARDRPALHPAVLNVSSCEDVVPDLVVRAGSLAQVWSFDDSVERPPPASWPVPAAVVCAAPVGVRGQPADRQLDGSTRTVRPRRAAARAAAALRSCCPARRYRAAPMPPRSSVPPCSPRREAVAGGGSPPSWAGRPDRASLATRHR